MTIADDRFVRIKEVLQMTGLSRSGLYRRMSKNMFPKSVQISDRCVAWRESAVKRWVRSQQRLRRLARKE